MTYRSLFRSLMVLVIAGLALSACNSTRGNKETIGGLSGAVLGGVLGAQLGKGSGQIVGAVLGATAGGFLGGEIGASLDELDRLKSDQAYKSAQTAPVGQTISWNNPDSGNKGTVTPVRDGTSSDGQYCREFQQTVTIDNKTEEAYGTACRQPDGSWKIQNS